MSGGLRSYSANPSDYKLLEEVGNGASATVYRAIYLPFNEVIAVKCLDLDRCNSNLDDVRKEAQTMSLIDHPNVIRAYCSFVVDHSLWVVMPYMAEGSCLHLMKIAYPDGFEEYAIGAILKETLKALEYLHRQGHIHRDVKAGNILLDTNGAVKLADFGVSACLFDTGDRQRARNTFTGTPCWMAPEVLQAGSGYNFKADIWSFGITALELAHGHAPFSKHPPMKVLLMTIQNAPPGLDYDRDKKFSKSFKEMVAMCLVKDQTKRPTAEKLLKHSFFKHAKSLELYVKKLFADLPPLWNRVKALQLKDAAQLALKRMPSAEQEAISQSEYQRGVSAWNFDISDLKSQASLVQDDDDNPECSDEVEAMKSFVIDKEPSRSRLTLGKSTSTNDIVGRGRMPCDDLLQPENSSNKSKVHGIDVPEPGNQERNGSSLEMMPSTSGKEINHPTTTPETGKSRQTRSGPLTPGIVLSHSLSERVRTPERSDAKVQPTTERANNLWRAPSFSGPLMLPNRASGNSLSAPIKSSGGYRDSLEDKSKTNLVQIKGRFSVTSENLDLVKDVPLGTPLRRPIPGSPMKKSASVSANVSEWVPDLKQLPIHPSPKEINNSSLPASLLTPHLQNLLQQTSIQQDLIMNMLNSLQTSEAADTSQNGRFPSLSIYPENNGIVEAAGSERERLLLINISELQSRLINLTDELTIEKLRYIQLQQQLNAKAGGEAGDNREEES